MAAVESLTADAIIAMINNGTWPTNFPLVTGDVIALNSQVAADVSLASNVAVHMKNTGSAATAAGVLAFEGSLNSTDGINGDWFSVSGVRSDTSGTIETGRTTSSLAAGASQSYGWDVSVNGVKWFRVRATTAFTASSIASITIARGAYASEPSVAVSPHGITGTVTVQPASGSTFQPALTASINATVVKASAGTLFEVAVFNGSAATIYLKLYDKSTTPAPATDSAVLRTIIPIAAGAVWNQEFGAIGKRFTAGISLATTAAVGATDATAIGAGVIIHGTYI